ncbi:MAG: DUF1573 domain-containing protein [Treponema sp.]|jgi:PBP1b-binding outer membrane lipoprotein LpoB|nr:DUF1573 domain-containing protein [Treponema sp.]
MKKLLVLIVIFVLFLVACGDENARNGNDNENTTLTIQNKSFSEITDVRWSSVSFTQRREAIKSGSSVTKTVQEGSGYIYFKRTTNHINARTDQLVVVKKNEQNVFVINNNTLIVDVDNPNSNNKDTFENLGNSKEPQITVLTGSHFIEQFGNYDFGTVIFDKDKDITFTIGNTGKADLKMNVVEGNIINLINNTSGYFSIIEQPFASMTIQPGNSTTFVIRFNPRTVGNNFNTEVKILTNSEKNAEFTFRVKGNGRDYIFGDTGPGGGTVFFAEGGQYKECSGELGGYNWKDAMAKAIDYKGGGLTDWYLPDREELDLMYQNLHKKSLGKFSNYFYWSSTEYSLYDAYLQNFSFEIQYFYWNNWRYYILSGEQDFASKTGNYCGVRAVRFFTL